MKLKRSVARHFLEALRKIGVRAAAECRFLWDVDSPNHDKDGWTFHIAFPDISIPFEVDREVSIYLEERDDSYWEAGTLLRDHPFPALPEMYANPFTALRLVVGKVVKHRADTGKRSKGPAEEKILETIMEYEILHDGLQEG